MSTNVAMAEEDPAAAAIRLLVLPEFELALELQPPDRGVDDSHRRLLAAGAGLRLRKSVTPSWIPAAATVVAWSSSLPSSVLSSTLTPPAPGCRFSGAPRGQGLKRLVDIDLQRLWLTGDDHGHLDVLFAGHCLTS
ncbi:MAG: hypothetical protein ACJ786_22155 [Catenulispora sp.]